MTKALPAEPDDGYERHRRRAGERQAKMNREGRDIGAGPDCVNPKRRAKCEFNLRKYLETYHAAAFELKWSPKHLELIDGIERAVLDGQLKAVAMPRGSGKTTILERAILWAVLYRHHGYAFLLAATDEKSVDNLESIKTEIMCNDLLFEDFPEQLHALRELEWIPNRCKGQHIGGEPTLVKWGKKVVCFPTVDGVPGQIIKVGGLLTAVRGSKTTHPNGKVVRPTIALIDDPQTRRSAKSAVQSEERAQIISGDVLGMAGPGQAFSALMACTVIERADMADKVLNRELHPHWRGQRTKLLESFPDRLDLWQTYNEILTDEFRDGGDGSQATKFYRKHRKEMDAGAKVSWKDRFNAGKELSAVQHAMNLWFRDQESFFSEYQNEPIDLAAGEESDMLSADQIAQRVNAYARETVPADASLVTFYIDVQDAMLYYLVAAWAEDFTGYVIDYGTWPKQAATYFTLRSAKQTLHRKWPKMSKEGRLRKALEQLIDGTDGQPGLMAREWKRDGDGALMSAKLGAVDSKYLGETVVVPTLRASAHRSRLLPAQGIGITSRKKPFSEYTRKPGDRAGNHWRLPKKAGRRAMRNLLIDTNYWKSFVHARLATDPHERGCLTLWKAQPKQHAMISDHLTAERKSRVDGHGRTVDEWKAIPGQDNHLLDCLVGSAVVASMEGCRLQLKPRSAGDVESPKKPQRRERTARPLF